jgi:hypothetical protein
VSHSDNYWGSVIGSRCCEKLVTEAESSTYTSNSICSWNTAHAHGNLAMAALLLNGRGTLIISGHVRGV